MLLNVIEKIEWERECQAEEDEYFQPYVGFQDVVTPSASPRPWNGASSVPRNEDMFVAVTDAIESLRMGMMTQFNNSDQWISTIKYMRAIHYRDQGGGFDEDDAPST